MTSKTLNLKCGILLLLFFAVFSCKKEDVTPNKKYSTGKSFQTDLQEKLIAYDKNHPILDSISAVGKIDWGKLMARYSIGNRNPINFDLPIITDGIANSLIEFAFTSDLKLIDIKIRRLNVAYIEEKTNINNFESTRTGRMLYQFSKQGLKINKSLLRYRQESERSNLESERSKLKVTNSLLSTQVPSLTVKKSSNVPPGPTPSAPINLQGYSNYTGAVHCYSELNFDFLFTYTLAEITDAQYYQQYLTERFLYNLLYRSDGILFNFPVAYSNKVFFYNTALSPSQLGDVVWRVLYYCVGDINQYMGSSNFQYYYYSVSGTCGNQGDGVVYYGEGPVNPFPEPETPEKEIMDSVDNPCIKSQVANAATAQTTIRNMMIEVFGGQDEVESLNLTFKDVTILPDTTSGDAKRWSATNNDFEIRLNKNTLPTYSKEYILSTIYHEVLHAYMFNQLTPGPDGKYNITSQHEDMANKYVFLMTGALKIAFPGISDQEAWGLSWGGLEDTNLYKTKLTKAQRDEITDINKAHTNKSATKLGTYCN